MLRFPPHSVEKLGGRIENMSSIPSFHCNYKCSVSRASHSNIQTLDLLVLSKQEIIWGNGQIPLCKLERPMTKTLRNPYVLPDLRLDTAADSVSPRLCSMKQGLQSPGAGCICSAKRLSPEALDTKPRPDGPDALS